IGLQALATLGWARRGALRSPAGLVGLGITAASWAGLYKIWQEAMSQGELFEKALEEGLGDDLDTGSAPLAPEEKVVVSSRRLAAGPLKRWNKGYVTGPALSYGDAGRRNELDIWRRSDLPKDGKAPVLL